MNKREYAQANRAWIEAKAQEEGVKALPRGIYYKVLSEGRNDGRHPSPRSIVTAHYTGWTINGKKFDSSRGGAPLAIRLCDLIEGWIVASIRMGDIFCGKARNIGPVEMMVTEKLKTLCATRKGNELFV